jgi:hypothetical protein
MAQLDLPLVDQSAKCVACNTPGRELAPYKGQSRFICDSCGLRWEIRRPLSACTDRGGRLEFTRSRNRNGQGGDPDRLSGSVVRSNEPAGSSHLFSEGGRHGAE